MGGRSRARPAPIVEDDVDLIEAEFGRLIADPGIDAVIATGGTGLTGRDVTPEALARVREKPVPGFGELFRWLSFQKIGTSTIQSRATAGVASGTYLFALPGSPGACRDAWDEILVHQLDYRFRPCNFVELMPRLTNRAAPRRAGEAFSGTPGRPGRAGRGQRFRAPPQPAIAAVDGEDQDQVDEIEADAGGEGRAIAAQEVGTRLRRTGRPAPCPGPRTGTRCRRASRWSARGR